MCIKALFYSSDLALVKLLTSIFHRWVFVSIKVKPIIGFTYVLLLCSPPILGKIPVF